MRARANRHLNRGSLRMGRVSYRIRFVGSGLKPAPTCDIKRLSEWIQGGDRRKREVGAGPQRPGAPGPGAAGGLADGVASRDGGRTRGTKRTPRVASSTSFPRTLRYRTRVWDP
jgi:hypothetical protein